MIVPVQSFGHPAASAPAISAPASGLSTLGRNVYLIFMVSWFLHLAARVPALGEIRIDLILVVVLVALALASKSKARVPATSTDKMLRVLIAYAVLTIPFVEWPGSVIRSGIPEFVKAVVFYYFTVAFIRTEADLKKIVLVFLACQMFRVLEPLYLHVTEGYWGSFASMSAWEFLDRLSGAPYDVVNPNGLAFVICTVLPFLYFLAGQSWLASLAFLSLTPACLYALALTGSRSGFLALLVIFAAILVKSRHRLALGTAGVLVLVAGFSFLGADLQDRYLSAFGIGSKNLATAEQRIEGIESDFRVALRRPVVGHGLGTSREANANFGTRIITSHNLFTEVLQELGFVGLVIYLLFVKSVLTSSLALRGAYAVVDAGTYLPRLLDAMQVWLWMNLLFSLASYGLSSYEWYLFGGLLVVMQRLAMTLSANPAAGSRVE